MVSFSAALLIISGLVKNEWIEEHKNSHIYGKIKKENPNAAWRRIEFFAEYCKFKGHEVAVAGAFSLKSLDKAGIVRWSESKILNMAPIILLANLSSRMFNTISSIFTSILPFTIVRPNIVIISVHPGETTLAPTSSPSGTKLIIDYRDKWEEVLISIA